MSDFSASSTECYEEVDVLIVALGDGSAGLVSYVFIARLDDEDNSSIDSLIYLQTSEASYEMAGTIKNSVRVGGLRLEVKPNLVKCLGASIVFLLDLIVVFRGEGKASSLRTAL
ncbi:MULTISPECIES: hypothetical protein [Pseudomonas]|uniref:hypothetical protein n=1 Tax=Pseudomonas TaxID=286 RepID=UPI0011197948|nr:hypothetical protein [Pseudomonas shirazica]